MLNFSPFGAALAAVFALAGCTASPDTADADREPQAPRTFSAEERRVAQALSVGGSDVREASSPRSYAMLCTMALDTLGTRMEDGALLSAEQRQAFAAARRIYRERATGGLSREEQDALRREVETAHPEPGDRARFGIGCLRELAGA